MGSDTSSPTCHRYLQGISAPQEMVRVIADGRGSLAKAGWIPSPLIPMVPILETSWKPSPPVPGLLPPCPAAIRPGERWERSGDPEKWLIWPVDAGLWFADLARALASRGRYDGIDGDFGSGDNGEAHDNPRLFPAGPGIPLAADPRENGAAPEIPTRVIPERIGWRALNLICWELEYTGNRKWYMSLRWRLLWHRRLKRAQQLTNNNKVT